jgi:integrase
MKWSQIDFYTKIWRIPESKNGETLNIPITDKVIEILKLRKQDNMVLGFENSEYVFPGNGATGHLVEPKKAWKNILNRAGIKDLRLHDLRRTFGSWQAITGTSMQIIGKSLGHKSSSATEIYARLSMDPVRESVEKVTKLIVDSEE